MREFLRVALARHRVLAVVCALVTVVVAIAASFTVPDLYDVSSTIYVAEPIAVHRLTNPAAGIPEAKQELGEVQELLGSQDSLVALVKRTGLMDQWDRGRPWALRQKDHLRDLVAGPMSEQARLDALVKMVESRVQVTVDGPMVRISAQWSDPEVAVTLVRTQTGALTQLREKREARIIEAAAVALDEQREAVRVEMRARVEHIEAAQKLDDFQAVAREAQQLSLATARAADLLVQAEQKHIAAEVFRSSNQLRFTVIQPPMVPKHPMGALPAVRVVVTALAALLAALVCVSLLALVSGRLFSGPQVERALGVPVRAAVKVGQGGVLTSASALGVVLALGLALVTGAAVGLARGQPLALLPPLVVLGAWLVFTRPLKWPVFALLLIALTADDPTGRAFVGLWQSPLWPLGRVFFTNIALMTGFELAFYGLVGVLVLRHLWPHPATRGVDAAPAQSPRVLQVTLVLSAVTVLWLTGWGVVRGGNFRDALWQFRSLLLLPIVTLLFMRALDVSRDLPKLLGLLVASGVFKGVVSAWFVYRVAYPQGYDPPHTTGHADSMILVTAVVTAVVMWWEKPSRWNFALIIAWLPFVALALKLNDRRVAYVELGVAFLAIYLLSPMHVVKRFVTRLAIAMVPVVLLYVAVGWNAQSRVFAPVQKIRSIVAPKADSEEESSSVERDIENFNIMTTWRENMFLGQGFGHAFKEYQPGFDFSQSNFGRVGHNSILWLFWIGGYLGFTCVLAYLAVALFLVGRLLTLCRDWRERAALFASLTIFITYLLQAFGDMGTQSPLIVFFVAVATTIVGGIASRHRVWS